MNNPKDILGKTGLDDEHIPPKDNNAEGVAADQSENVKNAIQKIKSKKSFFVKGKEYSEFDTILDDSDFVAVELGGKWYVIDSQTNSEKEFKIDGEIVTEFESIKFFWTGKPLLGYNGKKHLFEKGADKPFEYDFGDGKKISGFDEVNYDTSDNVFTIRNGSAYVLFCADNYHVKSRGNITNKGVTYTQSWSCEDDHTL